MMTPELTLSAVLSLLMAGVYYAVGRVVSRRQVSHEANLAKRSFALWWYTLSGVTALGVLTPLLSALNLWTVETLVVFTQVVLLLIVAALASLLYYFVYLFTGRHGLWKPIAAFHALYYIAILYFLAAADPSGIEHGAYGDTLEYGNDLSDSPAAAILGLLLLVPTMLGALGYVSLFRKVSDRSGRFRIAAIATAFLFWFGTSLAAGQIFDVAGEDWWRLASTAIAVAASLLVYAAFQPPKWVAKRFRLEAYAQSS